MKTNYVLIDFESVAVKSLALLNEEHFRVFLFLGPNNTKLPRGVVLAMHDFGERAKYVELETAGPNALDFHVAYYVGRLVAVDPTGFFHIISKDTGFDPLIQHLKTQRVFSARSESIEAMPCFQDEAPKSGNGASLEELVELVVADLIKRKAAKPRKVETLKSTIRARLGNGESAPIVDKVFAQLVKLGRVHLDGQKVSYSLPEK